MHTTHEIFHCDLGTNLDLFYLEKVLADAKLSSSRFNMLNVRSRGGLLQLFASGKAICHGNFMEQYIDSLEEVGVSMKPGEIKLSTRSLVHHLGTKVDYYQLAEEIPDVEWHPELFHAPMMRRDNICFTIFHTGNVVITGVKTEHDIEEIVWPTILELELAAT